MKIKGESGPILIVEDNDADFDVTTSALILAKVRRPLIRCSTGREAMQFINREGQFSAAERPSLILLDLNLPGIDGRKLLLEMRRSEWLRSVPVSVLSTSSNERDIEFCYAASANSYLVKPVELEKYETMISDFITYWFGTVMLPTGKSGTEFNF